MKRRWAGEIHSGIVSKQTQGHTGEKKANQFSSCFKSSSSSGKFDYCVKLGRASRFLRKISPLATRIATNVWVLCNTKHSLDTICSCRDFITVTLSTKIGNKTKRNENEDQNLNSEIKALNLSLLYTTKQSTFPAWVHGFWNMIIIFFLPSSGF